jgi:hypothetical protein
MASRPSHSITNALVYALARKVRPTWTESARLEKLVCHSTTLEKTRHKGFPSLPEKATHARRLGGIDVERDGRITAMPMPDAFDQAIRETGL